jgi:hypothetical protein
VDRSGITRAHLSVHRWNEADPADRGADGETPLPGLFVRFLGVAEVLGAIGLILPGLVRI